MNAKLESIKCTPGDLDDVRERFYSFSHFTVRNGKAKYHIFHLANNSCGLYYAYRMSDFGLEGRRALEPTDEITVYGTINQ